MKKVLIVLVFMLMIVLLTACAGQTAQEVTTEEVTQPEATEETSMPEEPVEPEQPEEEHMGATPGSSEDVINAMLVNPMQMYLGDSGKMSQNTDGHIGVIAYEHRGDDERMEVFAGNEGTADIPFETRLRDYGDENLPQQAVLVKFQPERLDYLRFDFIGMADYSITFEENEWWFVDIGDFSKMSFSEFTPNNFYLDGFNQYYLLFATDADMNLRVIIWADGDYQNQAYFETALYQGRDDIFDSNWKMNIGFGYSEDFGQLNIYEYAVYTFDTFTEMMPYNMVDEEEQEMGSMDFGPSWNINIANNFDIMSDMVWQSVQVQDFEAGGDTYKGYNLAEMMDFSGNGSDKARITFGQEGSDSAEVSRTGDAFIVFMKNGDFLGGPFLLDGDMLYDIPVIQVDPE